MDVHHAMKLVGRTLRSKVPIGGVPKGSLLEVENVHPDTNEISLCVRRPGGKQRLRIHVDSIEEKLSSEYGAELAVRESERTQAGLVNAGSKKGARDKKQLSPERRKEISASGGKARSKVLTQAERPAMARNATDARGNSTGASEE